INRHILTDILRGELGFRGFVVSDWEDIEKLVTQWKVAADEREATRMAVMAGIDMSMVPSDYSFADILVGLVKEGKVPQSRVDEAVRRILLVKFELGLFDKPMPDASLKSRIGLPASRQLALQAARESMTLLKNDGGLLPLDKGRKVLVTGPTADTPGNITDLSLGAPQLKLADAIEATGKPVVLVLVEGRPRVLGSAADRAQAVLMAYNPSNEGGTAIADVLFGDFNPGGRLPFTYPRSVNNLFNYDRKTFEDEDTAFGNLATRPQFEFGQGLSYTTFAYSDLRLGQTAMRANGEMPVSVTVTNTGRRAGHETVILYVRDLVASLAPPGRRVRRFGKVYLEPGQSRALTFRLRGED